MKKHVTAVGILNLGMGILGILIACLVVFVLLGAGVLSYSVDGDPQALPILAIIGVVVGGITTLLSLPGIIAGWGVLRYKNWARYLAMVIGVLNLFNFPIGSVVGAYTLWILAQDETDALFQSGGEG